MGLYRKERQSDARARLATTRKWVTMVAVSALIGSGATLATETAFAKHSDTGAISFSPLGSNSLKDVASSANMAYSNGVTRAVQKVEPAVVGIENYTEVSNYFSQQSKLEATGVGTGVMFYKDRQSAYLVTNNHVVNGAAKVDIVMKSGKHINATVVGTDPYTDLAVIKVPVSTFKGIDAVQFADSSTIQPGEPAIAIGTPMGLDFADTVTSGIVSAKQRIMPVADPDNENQTLDYQTVIQTDAAINPGNSGGPLLNIQGDVIGINSSKIVAPNFEGMGFAIPSNEVRSIARQLMTTGHAEHPALGITAYSLSSIPQQMWPDVPVDYGVWVRAISAKATQAGGLRADDVIVGINGKVIKTIADLRTYLFQTKPGETVKLKVYRDSKLMILKVKVGSMDTKLTTANMKVQSGEDEADPIDPFGGQY